MHPGTLTLLIDVAVDRGVSGDLFLQDAGQGFSFRPGSFDGAIRYVHRPAHFSGLMNPANNSISCLQWLCNADYKCQNPRQRLVGFFTSLYSALSHGSRAVFQFYPENSNQIELITSSAMQAGFTGGLVVDYPNSTKRKKYYLCLFVGVSSNQVSLPKGLSDTDGVEDDLGARTVNTLKRSRDGSRKPGHKQKRAGVKDRDWVLRKKDSQRRKGDNVPLDSKYTARKRKNRW